MPLYTYRVKNETGKVFTGEAKVERESDLVSMLIERGFTPIEIKERNAINDITQISIFQKRVKIKDIAIFCRQFAIVLEAGVPIAASLEVLKEQATNPTLKRRISDISDDIKKGISLSAAMKKHSDIFPELLINMVESGEVSGQLDRVFKRMADQFEKDWKLNQKIRSAMVYPIIVLSIAVVVVFILLTFVVPTFAVTLSDLNVEMPLYTQVLLDISGFFVSFWWLIAAVIIGLVIFMRYYVRSDSGKLFVGKLAIKFPVVKDLTQSIVTARFTRTLASLISSGVLLIQAMEVVQKVLGNKVVSNKLDEVIGEIKKGRGLSQPLANIKFFPPMVLSMIRIGEESGDLDFSLSKCADFYDEEVDASVKKLTEFINPAIVIVLAVIVGFIIISILLPMFSIYQNIE
jgi:type IV pilus assembly protein PilC